LGDLGISKVTPEISDLFAIGQPVVRLGMGGCPLGGHDWGAVDDADSVAAVRRALEGGVNFFDTADVYGLGHSEELLAAALGPDRHRVIVATKFGMRWDANRRPWKDTSPGYLRVAIENSLRRLRLSCVPLYYIHWPDGATPIAETMAELVRCRDQGKLRWIGLSNFSPAQVREAVSVAPVHALQVAMSVLDHALADELLPLARQTGIGLVTWGSLSQGLLTGKFNAQSRFPPNDRRCRYANFIGEQFQENIRRVETVKQIAARTGRTPAQVALRWLLDTPGVGVALVGGKRPAQIEENLGALDWQLDESDYQTLAAISLRAPT
jgi:aryl-alcohol dehydrogenase-like predicted oxidoreductase